MPTASEAGWSGAAERGRGEGLSGQKGSTQWTVTPSWRNQYFLSPWVAPCRDLAVLMFLRQEAELTSGSRRSPRLRLERGGGVYGACTVSVHWGSMWQRPQRWAGPGLDGPVSLPVSLFRECTRRRLK